MTKEQIIEMAKAAGFATKQLIMCREELKAFATLVRNATLEEGALRIEQVRGVWLSPSQADVTATEIRSLKS